MSEFAEVERGESTEGPESFHTKERSNGANGE